MNKIKREKNTVTFLSPNFSPSPSPTITMTSHIDKITPTSPKKQ